MKPAESSEQYLPLRQGAVVEPVAGQTLTADVVIIGSGMGGGTLAWALAGSGLEVLLVERGRFLPREPENSQVDQMFVHHRYRTAEPWVDGSTGEPFQPGNSTGSAATPRCTAPACRASAGRTSTSVV